MNYNKHNTKTGFMVQVSLVHDHQNSNFTLDFIHDDKNNEKNASVETLEAVIMHY